MSVDRQQGWLVFICDHCSSGLHTQTGDFRDAWIIARRKGWGRECVDERRGVWVHSCPACNAAKQHNTAA